MSVIAKTELPFEQRAYRPFAARPEISRGRQYPEAGCPMRSCFQRDRDRIVHSSGFRRLTHKTQVFIYHEGDHYRTRLTHTLEVAQIARSIARMLRLDEDLTEAIALAHDLGHSPFGHAGERALDKMMQEFGGFDHNAQSLKHVTLLERRYPYFDGLNLTYECLEGIAKHNGPLMTDTRSEAELAPYIREFNKSFDLGLSRYALLEAQVAALADDIAYSNHDIDDGLRADLININDLMRIEITAHLLDDIQHEHGKLAKGRLIYELNRRLITLMVRDIAGEVEQRLIAAKPESIEDIRNNNAPFVSFSANLQPAVDELRGFLFETVYRDAWVTKVMARASQIVEDLFLKYQSCESEMPDDWRRLLDHVDEAGRAHHICDFVAGMTDRFALLEHRRLFDATPELR